MATGGSILLFIVQCCSAAEHYALPDMMQFKSPFQGFTNTLLQIEIYIADIGLVDMAEQIALSEL